MSQIKQSALELVGNTPLVQVNRYAKKAGIDKATVLAKLEYFNPAGSVKDRIALAMIEDAERGGELKEGATILAKRPDNEGKNIVVLLTDSGDRYLSTSLFAGK